MESLESVSCSLSESSVVVGRGMSVGWFDAGLGEGAVGLATGDEGASGGTWSAQGASMEEQ